MDKKLSSKTKGVKARENAIQIKFRLKGQDEYCYETIKWSPTPANLVRAGKLRAEIVDKIKHGVFVYSDYFPESPRAQAVTGTFAQYAQTWLDSPENDWTKSTRNKFLGILENVWMPALHSMQINRISKAKLSEVVVESMAAFREKWGREPSKSIYNNWLLCIRGVFSIAVEFGVIRKLEDPTQDFTNKVRDKGEADPFDIAEANTIIAMVYKEHGPMLGAWFQLGFYTGIRTPGELSAITWDDVSLTKSEIRVNKTHTQNGLQLTTKTGKARTVRLNSESLHAIAQLAPLTRAGGGEIFRNKYGAEGTYKATWQRTVWRKTLSDLGIRYRDMYNMRHTYATFGLMTGNKPGYMAKQLGHNLQEFFSTYAKWIDGQENDSQGDVMQSAINKLKADGQITNGAELGQKVVKLR